MSGLGSHWIDLPFWALKLEWDHINLRTTNAPEADRIIHREYRAPWKLV